MTTMMSRFGLLLVVLVCLAPSFSWGFAFSFPTFPGAAKSASAVATTAPTKETTAASNNNLQIQPLPQTLQVDQVVTRVAVAGATGRVGRLVVQELLNRGVKEVVALVRDTESARETILNGSNIDKGLISNLQIQSCDLANQRQVSNVLKGVDAVIWCATGFSSKPNANPFEKAKAFFALATKQTIDVTALPFMGNVMRENNLSDKNSNVAQQLGRLPKVVMCSSAGVTRTIWDDKKKELMPGAADIPIVRLNPFGMLDIKRTSEDKLRDTGVDYTIVRPCGLNDNHPPNSRPLVSQGDVAVGRIHRKDVAKVLVDCLALPEATGKTFEVIGVAGYPAGDFIASALKNLRTDQQGLPTLDVILSTYSTLQQLLPGETQNSAALAMGQTYEQLDKGEVGRLGVRGQENAEAVAPKPTS